MWHGLLGLALALAAGGTRAGEQVVYDWNEDGTLGDLAAECRVFTSGGHEAKATVEPPPLTFRARASVAQWADVSVRYGQLECLVRRPGRYVIGCYSMTVQSNGDLGILRDDYGDLRMLDGPGSAAIELYVQTTPPDELPTVGRWTRASAWNSEERLTVAEDLQDGLSWIMWLGIEVTDGHSPGRYQTVGHNTLVLLNQKDWLDGNGDWLPN